MAELLTGFVRGSGCANKVRKVLFAITKGSVKPEEVVRAAGELNRHIFEKFPELGAEKKT